MKIKASLRNIKQKCFKLRPAILLFMFIQLNAQPQPEDLFREYIWYNKGGDAGEALRVGGRLDYGGDFITLDNFMDLEYAVKAEVMVEKILSHDGTRGLQIQINESNWMDVTMSDSIPSPVWDYYHHTYPVLDIPLDNLNHGAPNEFRFRVDESNGWWPQHLIDGVVFRIYYDKSKKIFSAAHIASPINSQKISENVIINVIPDSVSDIEEINIIGYYNGVNWEGDGIYKQWHYHYNHGELMHHIGAIKNPPFEMEWDTKWIPNQTSPIKLMAWARYKNGLIYATKAIDSMQLVKPDGISVELVKPYDIPKYWVTRKGRYGETVYITGNLTKAEGVKLMWASWSPCYEQGLYINKKLFSIKGNYPCYDYYPMEIYTSEVMYYFVHGANLIENVRTAGDKHGMEIQYPGIMLLVRYNENQPDPPQFNIETGMYYEQQELTIASSQGGTIRYTLDGSEPDMDDPVYQGTPVTIDNSTMVKARIWKADTLPSNTQSAQIELKVKKPEFNIESGTYYESQRVEISSSTNNTLITYTTNNTTPNIHSTVYDSAFYINGSAIVMAKAFKDGWIDSENGLLVVKIQTTGAHKNRYEVDGPVQVFTDPHGEFMNISMSNDYIGEIPVHVFNLLGKKLETFIIEKASKDVMFKLNTANFKQGLYLLKISIPETHQVNKIFIP